MWIKLRCSMRPSSWAERRALAAGSADEPLMPIPSAIACVDQDVRVDAYLRTHGEKAEPCSPESLRQRERSLLSNLAREQHALQLAAPAFASRLRTGDSIAVSGTCLTALEIEPPDCSRRSGGGDAGSDLSRLIEAGFVVNLELQPPQARRWADTSCRGMWTDAGNWCPSTR